MASAVQLRRESVLEIVKKHGYGRKASIVPESGVVFEKADVAPSPSRDYCQILVTRKEVIFRVWKISSRNDARVSPLQIRNSYTEFLEDDRCQSEIHRMFGKSMVDYVKNLCVGKIDYLPRLPTSVLRYIVDYLSLEDLSKLSCINKQFRKLCNSDEVWEKIYRRHSETPVTADVVELANEQGWKKLFFTNKLQLQVKLRRKMEKQKIRD